MVNGANRSRNGKDGFGANISPSPDIGKEDRWVDAHCRTVWIGLHRRRSECTKVDPCHVRCLSISTINHTVLSRVSLSPIKEENQETRYDCDHHLCAIAAEYGDGSTSDPLFHSNSGGNIPASRSKARLTSFFLEFPESLPP